MAAPLDTASAYNNIKSNLECDYVTGGYAGFFTAFTPVMMVVDLQTAEILAVDTESKFYTPAEVVDIVKQAGND